MNQFDLCSSSNLCEGPSNMFVEQLHLHFVFQRAAAWCSAVLWQGTVWILRRFTTPQCLRLLCALHCTCRLTLGNALHLERKLQLGCCILSSNMCWFCPYDICWGGKKTAMEMIFSERSKMWIPFAYQFLACPSMHNANPVDAVKNGKQAAWHLMLSSWQAGLVVGAMLSLPGLAGSAGGAPRKGRGWGMSASTGQSGQWGNCW